jgi:transposase InsO family protein
LKDISNIAEWNNCNHFVLIVVDAFSKKAYVRMLKDKTSKSMTTAFKSVFKEAKAKPMYIFSDQGSEFTSRVFRKFLKENDVINYHIYSFIKSMFSERFIRTLFTKLERYMTERQTLKIDDKIQDFVKTYNNTYHSTIKRTPNQVTKEDEYDVWYTIFKDYLKEKEQGRKPPKFKVEDKVRISRAKLLFEKGNCL